MVAHRFGTLSSRPLGFGALHRLSRRRGREVPATTRVAGFGVALLGSSYFVGGFEGPVVKGPQLDGVRSVLGVGEGSGGARGADLADARPAGEVRGPRELQACQMQRVLI